ncbi:MAG TPA: DUF4349 domain-containing protein [Dehalococcoidia bacterium]|nr:DUF4349 domain-containing protein [Dehalococcoidia bacterium]
MTKSLPIIGLLAVSVLAALAIACGGSVEDGDDDSGPQSGARAAATPAGLPANGEATGAEPQYTGDTLVPGSGFGVTAGAGVGGGAEGGAGGAAPAGSQSGALPALDRQIIRTATVELTVDDVAGTMQFIETATVGAGGFVSGSSLTVENTVRNEDEQVRQTGTITIRVPADRYTSALASIRGLVDDPLDIKSVQEETTEVTEEYTDLQSRLRNLEATETQYLALLEQATSIDDILTVQDRLNQVRGEIEQVTGRLQVLDDLTGLATITIQLSLPPLIPAVVTEETGSQHWASESLENAWQASEDTLQVLGVIGITAGVFLAWMLIPGVIALGAWWAITSRRTRGEAA